MEEHSHFHGGLHSWSCNLQQSSCNKQPIPLRGKASATWLTSSEVKMGILVPVESAGTCSDMGEVHRAGKSNWGMGEKEITFYSTVVYKFKIRSWFFFSLLDPFCLLCKESDVSKERRIYRPLYTNLFSPKSPKLHSMDVKAAAWPRGMDIVSLRTQINIILLLLLKAIVFILTWHRKVWGIIWACHAPSWY